MRVKEVLESFSPAYCDSWPEVIEYLTSDPYESKVVASLVKVLGEGGRFTQPIRLDQTNRMVGNGMHRLVAAQIAGLDEIDVVFTDSPESECMEVSFECVPSTDETFDVIIGVLRSFAWPPGRADVQGAPVWVEAVVMGSSNGRFSLMYDIPFQFAGQLVTVLSERLAVEDLTMKSVFVAREALTDEAYDNPDRWVPAI
jgi:hypothetical protein